MTERERQTERKKSKNTDTNTNKNQNRKIYQQRNTSINGNITGKI
jgi:hypothetical protein